MLAAVALIRSIVVARRAAACPFWYCLALVHALLHNVGVRSLKTAHSYITYARQEKMRRARKQKKTAGEIILSERDQKS